MTGTPTTGRDMLDLISSLYPICRSITGDGMRESLRQIAGRIPLEIHEVPTGTRVFDWTVPREWNIRDAYVKDASGTRVIDFNASNLHVVNYSMPVRARMTLDALRPHLHTIPEHPTWIPYRTSYYEESWGFCLAHRDLEALPDGEYEVCVDATLEDGHLTYGEYVVPGTTSDEVLISCHSCHPSLCNDNLSGVAVAVALAERVSATPHRLSYRFLFIPGTIGSITWLAEHADTVSRIRHGLVLTCVGDRGAPTYKRSRRGDALVDRAATHVLQHHAPGGSVQPFTPYGYDERQYCSPGFDLPVGCLMRTPNGTFPEYHTSADNLDFITPESLSDSLAVALQICEILEHDAAYVNLNPQCEPQLGRRGLYRGVAAGRHLPSYEFALLWVLNRSTGSDSLLDIAERSGIPFETIRRAAEDLQTAGLLARA